MYVYITVINSVVIAKLDLPRNEPINKIDTSIAWLMPAYTSKTVACLQLAWLLPAYTSVADASLH